MRRHPMDDAGTRMAGVPSPIRIGQRPHGHTIQALGLTAADRRVLTGVAAECSGMLIVNAWEELRLASSIWVIVAAVIDDETAIQLSAATAIVSRPKVLLATEVTEANLRRLGRIFVDDVIDRSAPIAHWIDTMQSMLGDQRTMLADAFRVVPVPAQLQLALVRLTVAVPPFRTIKTLARSVGCSPSLLRRQFQEQGIGYRLEDVVDWFVLHYYGWPNESGRAPDSTAPGPPAGRTLDRMSLRLLGALRKNLGRPGLADHPMIRALIHL